MMPKAPPPLPTEKVMVTAEPGGPPPGAIVATPAGMPDIKLVPLTKMRQIIIRTVRTYLQSLLGLLTLKFGAQPSALMLLAPILLSRRSLHMIFSEQSWNV